MRYINGMQLVMLIAVLIGSVLLGSEFGWKVGMATFFFGYAMMPYGRK